VDSSRHEPSAAVAIAATGAGAMVARMAVPLKVCIAMSPQGSCGMPQELPTFRAR
jgi:hypothetical protein